MQPHYTYRNLRIETEVSRVESTGIITDWQQNSVTFLVKENAISHLYSLLPFNYILTLFNAISQIFKSYCDHIERYFTIRSSLINYFFCTGRGLGRFWLKAIDPTSWLPYNSRKFSARNGRGQSVVATSVYRCCGGDLAVCCVDSP